MKKILYFAALTLLMVSCTDDYKDWLQQKPASDLDPVTVTMNVGSASAIDYAGTIGETVQLFVPTLTANKDGVSTYDVVLYNDDKSASVQLSTDANGQVSAAELKEAVIALYGRSPKTHSIALEVIAYTDVDGVVIKNVGTTTASVKLDTPVIETAYYYVGAANDWGGQTYKFTNSGADVYDDPVFSVTVPAQDGDHWFKVMPESAFSLGSIWDSPSVVGVYTNGTSALEGSFIVAKNGNDTEGSGANAWCIKEGENPADYYKITLNMMEFTYTITPITLGSQYYLVGAAQGWNSNAESGKTCLFTPESKSVVSYTTKWTGDHNLKIWAEADFGDWGKCYGALTDGDSSAEGALTNSGSGAIVCPEADAFYTITLNFGTMTYKWTKLDNQAPTEYDNISLIGEFNGWGGDFDLQQVTPHNWYAVFTQESDGMLKYRANHDWGTNWGFGNDGDWNVAEGISKTGTNGGGNIYVPAGTYAVYLNDITNSMLFVAQ